MELSQLNTFVVVAKTLHFTRAAEVLNLTQPAVSNQIKILENELGHQLFIRGKGDIRLTDAGEILLEYAKNILDKLDEMKVKINELDFKRPSSIKAAAVTNSVNIMIFVVLQRLFRKKYKKFDLQFESACSSEEIIELILNRDVEIGFVREGLCSPNIMQVPFVSTQFEFVVGNNHPLAKKTRLTLNDLKDEEWILLVKGNGFRTIVDNYFKKIDFQPSNLVETNDALFLLEMIKGGGKISILPEPIIQEVDFKFLKIKMPPCKVQINAAFLKSKENDFYYEFLEAMLESGLSGFTPIFQKKQKATTT